MLVEKAIEEDSLKDKDVEEELGMHEEDLHEDDIYEDEFYEEDNTRSIDELEQESHCEGEVDYDLRDKDLEKDSDLVDETYLESSEEMSESSLNLFKSIIDENEKKRSAFKRLNKLRESIISFKKAILLSENNDISRKNIKRIAEIYKNLCKELKNIGCSNIIKSDVELFKEYKELYKELNQMSRRRSTKNNFLNESLEDLLEMDLFEADEDEDEDEEETKDEEETEEEESDAEMIDPKKLQDPVEKLSDAAKELSKLVGLSDEEDDDLMAGLEDEDADEDEDENENEDLDLEEEGAMYEMDNLDLDLDEDLDLEGHYEGEDLDLEGHYEGEDHEEGHDLEEDEDDPVLEIDEDMLKTEIAKMRRLREGEAKEMAHHFGGGKLEKEMFIDVDDSLLNKHDKMKNESAIRKAVKKNRMLESKVSQYKKVLRKMKTQLTEMNLFNAKLLYANKLMQNRDLSIKQQKHIVESLDNANTLNEAKLLFESLSKSLVKNHAGKARLSEGRQRKLIGSSSRSTSSAQKLNENVALDRWATLAGIKK
ncbi:hypothetical protein [Winogradskyella sp.]|uniref:hypothetical protein n=1 Tax=Winogradskyella sp. TaxID=1883156 RepID=UPI003F69F016